MDVGIIEAPQRPTPIVLFVRYISLIILLPPWCVSEPTGCLALHTLEFHPESRVMWRFSLLPEIDAGEGKL